MANEARSVVVRLRAEANQYIREFDRAGRSTDQLTGSVDRSGKSVAALIKQARLLAIGSGIASLTKQVVGLEAAYSKTMAQIAVQTKAPQAELKRLDALAMQLGKDTVFSAQDAADAMLSLAKGGLSTAQIEAGALKNSLTLAAAGGLELDEAAKAVVNTMGAFELGADQTGVAVAALAGAANASSADVSDITQALAQAGTEANSVGLSVQETTALLAAFANAGIKGSDAGTSLRTMLTRLVPQTDKQAAEMKRLGLSFTTANGEFVNAEQIAQRMQDTFGGMTSEERSMALTTIFGADARRAANVVTRLGADGVRRLTNETSDLTQAQKLADANMSGTAGSIEQLKGAAETLGIELGKALAPTVRDVADGLTDLISAVTPLVSAFGELPESVQKLLILGTATTALTAGMRGLGRSSRDAGGGLLIFGGNSSKAAGQAGKAAGKVSLLSAAMRNFAIAAGVLVAIEVGKDVYDEIARYASDATTSVDDFSASFSATGEATEQTADALERVFGRGQIGKNAKALGIDLGRLADDMRRNGTEGEYFTKVMKDLDEQSGALGVLLNGPAGAAAAARTREGLEAIAKAFQAATKDAKEFSRFAAGTAFDLNFGNDTFTDAAGNVRTLAEELQSLPPTVQSTFALQGFDVSEKQLVDFIAKYDLSDVQIQALIEADPTPVDATIEQLRADSIEIKTKLVMDNLDAPIETLLKSLGGPLTIPLDANPAPLDQTAAERRKQLAETVATMLIDGNTDQADKRRDDLVASINKQKPKVPVDANTNPGKSQVDKFVSDTNKKTATIKVKVTVERTLENFNQMGGLTDGGATGGRIQPDGTIGYAGGGRVPGTPPDKPWMDNVRARTPAGHQLMVRSGEWIINEPQSRKNDAWLRAINGGLDLNGMFGSYRGGVAARYGIQRAASGRDPRSDRRPVFATASAVGAAPSTEFSVVSSDLAGARVDIGKDGMAKFVDGRIVLGIRKENRYRTGRG